MVSRSLLLNSSYVELETSLRRLIILKSIMRAMLRAVELLSSPVSFVATVVGACASVVF